LFFAACRAAELALDAEATKHKYATRTLRYLPHEQPSVEEERSVAAVGRFVFVTCVGFNDVRGRGKRQTIANKAQCGRCPTR
jgi:hypothetical protein